MDLFSIFKGGKYFDKHMEPKCDYCRFGKRAKDGNKVLCEKRGLVDCNYSCGKFIYSPLKRIPVKQLNFVGSLADEDLYIESAGDRAEKEEELKKSEGGSKKADNKKADDKKADAKKPENAEKPAAPEKTEEAPKAETPAAPENGAEAPKEEKPAADAPAQENGSAE